MWPGYGFFIALPDAARGMAQVRGELIRRSAGQNQLFYERQFLEAATLCPGVAVFPRDDSASAAFLAAAEAAL
jgi:hypothetical protein